jgi:hypothetical protein
MQRCGIFVPEKYPALCERLSEAPFATRCDFGTTGAGGGVLSCLWQILEHCATSWSKQTNYTAETSPRKQKEENL